MYKPKPWWMQLFTSRTRWLTLYPYIYHPSNVVPDSWTYIKAHEEVHLKQQEGHLYSWLFKYFLNRKFRLDQEAEAIAVELVSIPDKAYREERFEQYCVFLSTSAYFWAASSQEEARVIINTKLLLLNQRL